MSKFKKFFNIENLSENCITYSNARFFHHLTGTLSAIFISTFLLASDGDLQTVALYHIFFYLSEIFGAYFSTRYTNKISSAKFASIGVLLETIAFVVMLVMREKTLAIYPLIGVLFGLGGGFYWNGVYTLIQIYTTTENRQACLSYIGLITNTIALITPSLSGVILIAVPGISGYVIVFGIAFLFSFATTLTLMKLKNAEKGDKERKIMPVIREFKKEKVVSFLIIASIFTGLKTGVFTYYFNSLIYELTQGNELLVGLANTLKGALAILTFYILGRHRFSNKGVYAIFLIAVIISIAMTSSLFLWYTALAIVVYVIVEGTTALVIENYVNFSIYEIGSYISRNADLRTETTSIHIISLEIGRCLGIALSLIIPLSGKGTIAFFVALCAANLVVWALFKRSSIICEGRK